VVRPPPAAARAAAAGAGQGIPSFTVLKGTAAPLDVQNVDTDMIIPKQFLKTIKRTGLGVSLFWEMRYNPAGLEKPEFVLNQPAYRKASILVAGANFGCGSSREHAPWALNDFGLRCVIAPSFADIFFNNCFKNGMLPIRLPQEQVQVLMGDAQAALPLEIDLPNQRVLRANGEAFPFQVDAFRKHCLLNGLDDIGLTLAKEGAIAAYERKQQAELPWLWNGIRQKEKVAA
jgi:3-isopropylmalate dehydratase small subunit